jgi:hypothetical protein
MSDHPAAPALRIKGTRRNLGDLIARAARKPGSSTP